ncbi:MAG: hypothetical protein HDR74_06475 [Bacteroides sp.]|nr:hypothetical protein [Bacteroides sp.]MDE5809470.1 hypothetical protein [Muribaculaceae bacterium]
MNNIARHIEYLLQRNDCVVVPRLGAFIIRHTEAHYDSIKRQFMPPTATVIFNPELDHNDGMLAKSIARANSISYDEALQELTKKVAEIKETLKTDGYVEIGAVGSFKLLDGKRRIFTPGNKYSIVHKLAALTPLAVTTVQMRADDVEDTSSKTVSKNFILRLDNLFRVAASIILLLLTGLLCSTPITVDSANITYASVYPAVNDVEQPGATITQPDIELIFAKVQEVPETPQIVVPHIDEIENESNKIDSKIHFDLSDPYILVVSSFDSYSKAKEFMSSKANKRYKMAIIENGGRYRVYASTGCSMDDAALAMKDKDFAKRYPSAWACEK